MTRTRQFLQQTITLPLWLWTITTTCLWALVIAQIVMWIT